MEQITDLKEIQNIELNILVSFDEFCKTHGIHYSLDGGTLLGAIRHSGFIPWDDDIDVIMLRAEYNKFIKLVKENNCFISQYYRVLIPQESADYAYPYIKIEDIRTYTTTKSLFKKYNTGIFIDLFPLDYAYNNDDLNHKLVLMMQNIEKKLWRTITIKGKTPIRTVLKAPYNLYYYIQGKGPSYWLKKFNDFPIINKSDYVQNFFCQAKDNKFYRTEWVEEYIDVNFEGYIFSAFKGYDNILKVLYCDYMKLPPLEERYSHGFDAFWI